MSQGDELSAAEVQGAEAGNARAALAGGIGVVELEVVDEVIGGEESTAVAVAVKADAALVVTHGFGLCTGGECACADIRKRDVLKQMLRRGGPRALRDYGV